MFDRFIPTPSNSSIELGAITVHFYALCILIGILVALAVGRVRWRKSGGMTSELYDLAIYVIPAGIVGGRLYHVMTTPELYFGSKGHLSDAFKIWEGGMGIWGAVAMGTAGAFLFFRYPKCGRSISFALAADALAPGILLAQAIGRWGNWFNHELFGSPSTLPWALKVPVADRPFGYESYATFHPAFLYESIWCLLCAGVLLYLPRVRRLAPGNTFLLFISLYSLGRGCIETLRIDSAHLIWGLRLNIWVATLCGVVSMLFIIKRERFIRSDTGALDTLKT